MASEGFASLFIYLFFEIEVVVLFIVVGAIGIITIFNLYDISRLKSHTILLEQYCINGDECEVATNVNDGPFYIDGSDNANDNVFVNPFE